MNLEQHRGKCQSWRVLEIQEEAVWDSELTELEEEELQDFQASSARRCGKSAGKNAV